MRNVSRGMVMQGKYTRVIWLSILFTILAIVAICVAIFAILYFAMPKDLADFTYSVGNERFASHLYFKAYEKNDDIDLCYKALNLKIKVKDNKGIVEVYEAYLDDDEYESYNQLMKIHNENVNCSILERSVILNDENYLENKYISALILLNERDKAFDRAVDNFAKYQEYTFKEQGFYNLNYFITDTSKYSDKYEGYSLDLLDAMQDYFDKAVVLFNDNKEADKEVDKAYLMALGNRLLLVGQNINSIYTLNNSNSELKAENLEILQSINDVLKGLL